MLGQIREGYFDMDKHFLNQGHQNWSNMPWVAHRLSANDSCYMGGQLVKESTLCPKYPRTPGMQQNAADRTVAIIAVKVWENLERQDQITPIMSKGVLRCSFSD